MNFLWQKTDVLAKVANYQLSDTCRIVGSILQDDNLIFNGVLIGNIEVKKEVTISNSALIHGHVYADLVIVSGDVRGDVLARKIILKSTARIKGSILATELFVESGASISGEWKVDANLPDF